MFDTVHYETEAGEEPGDEATSYKVLQLAW